MFIPRSPEPWRRPAAEIATLTDDAHRLFMSGANVPTAVDRTRSAAFGWSPDEHGRSSMRRRNLAI
jgi:hypothetical protein